jgi:hypothetical protein
MTCVHCGSGSVVPINPVRKRGYNNAAVRRPYTVEWRGELLSLKQIARREGVAYSTLTERFRNDLRGDKLVAKVPPMRARPKARAA